MSKDGILPHLSFPQPSPFFFLPAVGDARGFSIKGACISLKSDKDLLVEKRTRTDDAVLRCVRMIVHFVHEGHMGKHTSTFFFRTGNSAVLLCAHVVANPFAALQKSPRLGTGQRSRKKKKQEAGEDPRRLGAFHAAVSVSQVRKMQRVKTSTTAMAEPATTWARTSSTRPAPQI